MRSFSGFVKVLVGCHALTACSTYPMPQDYSGFNTHQIVINVRCEAREALRDAVITSFKRYHPDRGPVYRSPKGQYFTGPAAAQYFEESRQRFETFDIDRSVIGAARGNFRYYKTTQIAYDFSLKGAETNKQGIDLVLTRQFGLRADRLGFGNSVVRDREVTRGFFVWDGVERLLKVSDTYCQEGKAINLVYPVTGRLPIYDLVISYMLENDQGVLTNAQPNDLKELGTGPKVPQMADTIKFKTQLNANMSPSFAYNPVGMGLQVSTLGLVNDNQREDTHTVVVAISTAEKNVPANLRPGVNEGRGIVAQSRAATAVDSIEIQNNRRFRDAIISIGDGFSQLPF
ncbi:hypothetical protein [Methylorubrum populi]|uniref:hypothetical protein n=1 Tax=Methylorubrum populi TaxID=223967 RepID=UPI003F655629